MAQSHKTEFGTIAGVVTDEGGKHGPITGAEITVFRLEKGEEVEVNEYRTKTNDAEV